ncbi:MAG: response regulator [Deltaproteobacteria bacterium]|nr:response regulator [Deltaproteobacteria bacterium]
MTTKILVADDSATMRQVISMTFGGEDARVVGVASGEAALATARGDRPDIVLADASMTGMTGYELARALRREGGLADIPVVLLSSQHHPYDEVLGKQCGVDDHISKPFDTQSLIDRVSQVLARPRPAVAVAAAPAPAPAPVAMTAAAAVVAAPAAGIDPRRATMAFGAAGAGAAPPAARPAGPPPRPPAAPASGSLPLGRAPAPAAAAPQVAPGGIVGGAQARPAAAAPAAAPAARAPEPAAAPAAAPAPKAAAAVAAATSAMDAKLTGEMGLTRDQADAVLKLSREVIEKVVWEVVPELAETIIKEEIRRLTQEA